MQVRIKWLEQREISTESYKLWNQDWCSTSGRNSSSF